MEIIKEGNPCKEYIYECPLCGCVFSVTARERAGCVGGVPSHCPSCGNIYIELQKPHVCPNAEGSEPPFTL